MIDLYSYRNIDQSIAIDWLANPCYNTWYAIIVIIIDFAVSLILSIADESYVGTYFLLFVLTSLSSSAVSSAIGLIPT